MSKTHELIVDFHIHSRFAQATSKELTVENIYKWCKIKGINVIGTGDFTHPEWLNELKESLEPAEDGLYKVKKEIEQKIDPRLPASVRDNTVRFILTVEISNIYSRGGKVRRVHNQVILPSFSHVEKFNAVLSRIGNLKADGRPILGLDSKKLLEISLETTPDSLFIPVHIWTPWYAMFGSQSGFDSVEEAFGDLAHEIKAIETGLSSDPFMNWRVPDIAGRTILSGSDAHSLPKMAREATILQSELSYKDIIGAVKTNDKRFVGTLEFFPEEGKYHLDGHRKCNFNCNPEKSESLKNKCPVCGRSLTIGVLNRVQTLANKPLSYKPAGHKSVEYFIPLIEIIAGYLGIKSTNSKKVQQEYENIYSTLGSDFMIARKMSALEIKNQGFSYLAQAVHAIRNNKVEILPGYDGVYGKVNIPFEKPHDIQLSLDV